MREREEREKERREIEKERREREKERREREKERREKSLEVRRSYREMNGYDELRIRKKNIRELKRSIVVFFSAPRCKS